MNNKGVTNNGILYLCSDLLSPYGRCKKIKELSIFETSVNYAGVNTALLNLHDLESFWSPDLNITLEGLLAIYSVYNGSKKLQLNTLVYCSDYSPFVNANITNICKMLPNVSDAEFMINDLTPLLSLPNITCLNLNNSTLEDNIQITDLFAHLGSKLIQLNIEYCDCTIDLSVIGYFCPNIKEISLYFCTGISRTCAQQLLPHSFQKLETIKINLGDNHIVTLIPTLVLTQILSSNVLKWVDFFNSKIPENTMLSLISKAKKGSGIFSNLRTLSFVDDDEYSAKTWLELFCVAPNLRQVWIYCNRIHNDENELVLKIRKLIILNNLNISFSRD